MNFQKGNSDTSEKVKKKVFRTSTIVVPNQTHPSVCLFPQSIAQLPTYTRQDVYTLRQLVDRCVSQSTAQSLRSPEIRIEQRNSQKFIRASSTKQQLHAHQSGSCVTNSPKEQEILSANNAASTPTLANKQQKPFLLESQHSHSQSLLSRYFESFPRGIQNASFAVSWQKTQRDWSAFRVPSCCDTQP